MKPYQERVVEELKALEEKILSLDAFIQTDDFKAIFQAERTRMERQLEVMHHYARILCWRIEGF